jgi:diguanylate cyclase (GGDEF)-like protein
MNKVLVTIYRDLPIGKKLMLLIMLICGVVLGCSIAIFVVSETLAFRLDQREELASLADIVSRTLAAPLAQGSHETASQTLDGLSADSEILGAYLLDSNGLPFARFLSTKGKAEDLPFARLPSTAEPDQYRAVLARLRAAAANPALFDRQMTVVRDISLHGRLLGTLVIKEESQLLRTHSSWLLATVLLIMGGTFLVAYAISSRLQHLISTPLLNLVDLMRQVSVSKDYALRAVKPSNDEVGLLCDGFNEMLAEIEERNEILRQRQSHLQQLAHFDSLTRLPNRTLFYDRLSQALHYAHRTKENVAVIFIDLDHFKDVNDTLGHRVGDLLLKDVADRLVDLIRGSDTVARLGGDEFTIFAQDVGNPGNACRVAQKIVEVFTEPFQLDGQQVYITASIGVTMYPTDGETVDELLKNADLAMYQAKEKGKNAFHLFNQDMQQRASQRLLLGNDLRHALEAGELSVCYQPKIDLLTGRLTGVEALVRWQHPLQGPIPPSSFIPLAEETGLIFPLGEWVLRTACQQGQAWQAAYGQGLRVAVNLSAVQFKRQDVVRTIGSILQETGLGPEFLEVELTETTLMQGNESTIKALLELRQMGIGIAIDDFGTGYSSLSYLRRFPIDTLKIDKSFTWNITKNEHDSVIIAAIIAMARGLKLNVVAEGVETVDQLRYLQEHGCNEVQGYLLSRPVPAHELDGLIQATGSLLPTQALTLPLF